MESLKFDIVERREIPVDIGGKQYVLCEATGAVAKKYRGASLAGARMSFNDADGTRTIDQLSEMASVESLLVSLCLFEILADGKRIAVKREIIESWPARVQKSLFEKAKEISDLEEKEDDLPSLRKKLAKLQEQVRQKEEAEAGKDPT